MFLNLHLVPQAGGYGSPSVQGYGYGYSSPAATPLFGKFSCPETTVILEAS